MRSISPSRRSPPWRTCPSGLRSATRTAHVRCCARVSREQRDCCRTAVAGADHGDSPAPRPVPVPRRGGRARSGDASRRAQARDGGGLRRPFPRESDHARGEDGRGPGPGRRGRRARRGGESGQARTFCGHRPRALQADRAPRRRVDARVHSRDRARADRPRQGARDRRRGARGARHVDLRSRRRAVIGSANGKPVSITGLGCEVPDRVVTNEDLAVLVETTDEWIVTRTGIHERRLAEPGALAMSELALPAARQALEQAGVAAREIDLLIVATVTPDMAFPSTSAIIADALGSTDAAAYDLSAGCTGFMYAIAQAYGMLAAGLSTKALVIGGDVLSSILDWTDRSTLVLFGDGAGAVVMEQVESGGFLGFELGADGGGGDTLWLPGSGSRKFEEPDRFVKMNGREVFKFATRVMVTSADAVLKACGKDVADVDVY